MSAVQRRSTQTAACSGAVLEDRQESRSHSQVLRTPAPRQPTVTPPVTLTAVIMLFLSKGSKAVRTCPNDLRPHRQIGVNVNTARDRARS